MQALEHLNAGAMLDTLVSVGAAFVLGSLIGLERQVRQRTAGLRTNTLVAVAAAAFVDLAQGLSGNDGAVRVVAYVVSGVGFLGAGAIMKEGVNVMGLNTAATLWGSAAVGACAGADRIGEALVAALFVIASNTLLRPVADRINRTPLQQAGEASYTVHVICSGDARAEVHDRVIAALDVQGHPVRDVEQRPFGPEEVEIQLTLYATSVAPAQLDSVLAEVQELPGVSHAFWGSGTQD
ncbi:MgtC/SapB family protein [Variovorax sp. OV329]|uniref:MgtC/SapB family protein n=1 Tax=Variovorax sp. OV329 TaxID=1882825 RepID=UPI0008E653E5|nr:MgtC/SapB family protein [Variovorax sp. OV329]SFM92043.1 putative Mg2+ transporter-C (MgtC) family protein [Variovorax sp. OV329]